MAPFPAADAVPTPWGRSDRLRERKLKPGPGVPKAAVAKNQRRRLFGAMVACVATKGYGATTVADLIAVAGVSRATFYGHFADKAECFRKTNEVMLNAGLTAIRERLGAEVEVEKGIERALRGFLALAAEQPAAARVSLVDAYAAGGSGLEPINEAFEQACELTHEALRELPERERTPPELARAVVGGLHRVIYKHLQRGAQDELLRCCGELFEWATGFEPPCDLPVRRVRQSPVEATSPFGERDRHEALLRAFARVVARHGYPTSSVPLVAAEAKVSNSTFYQHFEDKEDALLAALDLSGAQLLAAVLPAARREPDWRQALARALERFCDFLVAEPAYARLRSFEVYTAGPHALAKRDEAWDQILEELLPRRFLEGSNPGPLALEASSGAIDALLYEKVRRQRLRDVQELPPLFTYLMLTPLVGAEEAREVVDGSLPRTSLRA